MIHGLDQLMERKEGGCMYLLWVPLIGDVRTLMMDEAHASRLPRSSSRYDTNWVIIDRLTKYWTDANLHVHVEEIKVDKTVYFAEELDEIIDRESCYVAISTLVWASEVVSSGFLIVKVRRDSKRGPKFTWEREDHMKAKDLEVAFEYPVFEIPQQLRDVLPSPFHISQLRSLIVLSGTFCIGDIVLLCGWDLAVDGASVTSFSMLFSIPTISSVKLIGFTNNDAPIVEVDELGYQLAHTLQVYDPISE
ncbi:hypothetical protein Tco_1493637 [Tanacetum coccineum]